MNDINFNAENIPIKDVAKIMRMSPQSIREGIINKTLPIGMAFKREGSSHYSFYINQKMLFDFTGYLYQHDYGNDK